METDVDYKRATTISNLLTNQFWDSIGLIEGKPAQPEDFFFSFLVLKLVAANILKTLMKHSRSPRENFLKSFLSGIVTIQDTFPMGDLQEAIKNGKS